MKKSNLFLVGLLVSAIFLRFYQSPNFQLVPPALNWDEASLGYNAYSILKTGKDEWGRYFPLTFEAFGDYKLPGYIYTDVPFVYIFGLTPFSVRLPSQTAGVLSVLLLYLIVKKITDSERWALVSAAFLTVSPWHIFLSRIALEANLAFFIFLGALYLFIMGLKQKKYLIFSSVLFGLTIFTYNSARIFVPIFVLGLIMLYKKELLHERKKLIVPTTLLGIFVLVGAYLAIFKDSTSRYFWVAIVNTGTISFLEQARNNSSLPPLITKLIYNRYSYLLVNIISNYLSHFSPDFLFLNGGSNYQFSLPNNGLLYIAELPLLILGFIKMKSKPIFKSVLLWLFLAPIPSAITREAPHALRSIFMLGSIQIISGNGVLEIIEHIKEKTLKTIVALAIFAIFALSLYLYMNQYIDNYSQKYSSAWQYGYKEVFQYLSDNNFYNRYRVVISKKYGEPHIFYLFYNLYDPSKYQNNPTLIRYERSNWRWVDRLDNIFFVNDWEIKDKERGQKNTLLVTSPGNYPENFALLKSINFLDGTGAFDILLSR